MAEKKKDTFEGRGSMDAEIKEKIENIDSLTIEDIGEIIDYISGIKVKATPEEVEAVQVFAKRLVEDYDYKKDQIQTHPQFRVRKRPSDEEKGYPIDIAVFKNSTKVEDNLFIIVECKAKNRKDGRRQLEIYMEHSPAQVGVWFNGSDHLYLRKIVKSDGTVLYPEIPNIPKCGQRVEDVGKFKRKDLISTHNLKSVFKDIRNHLAGLTTGITRDESIAQEIINILSCKIYDELNTGPEEVVTFRCGIDEKKSGVKKRILELFEEKVKKDYSDVFDSSDNISLDEDSLTYVVGELQNYCITKAEREALGDAFEVFIGPALKGSEGQFFTPRNIVKLAVEILDPKPEEFIIDPACGSGGFLIVALEHVWGKIAAGGRRKGLSDNWIKDRQKKIATDFFRGIDKDRFLSKVTKAYMAIVGDGRGGIFCENTLFNLSDWQEQTRQKIELGKFDVLLTNPPFGQKIVITGNNILNQFDLANKWKFDRGNNKWTITNKKHGKVPPQILFIERCLNLLKPNGRMAIVLPDGVLGGDKVGYIANFIKQKAEVLALIDLPKETFSPNTTTKTHLVILRKLDTGVKIKNYKVFMGVAYKVGHDRKGRTIYKPSEKGLIVNDDIPEIINEYKKIVCKGERVKEDSHYGFITDYKWLEDNLVVRRYLPDFIKALEEIEKNPNEKMVLGEIAESINTGANVSSEDYVIKGKGTPYILVKNLTYEGINCSDLKSIDESCKVSKCAFAKEGDILINRCGNTGIASVTPSDLNGSVVCGFMFK